jgi:hypothetical protein
MIIQIYKKAFIAILTFLCISTHGSTTEIEKLAKIMTEAQTLVETRIFLRGLNEKQKNGIKIDKNAALKVADKIEIIAINGSKCGSKQDNDILRSQAYALVAGINGILSKDNKSIKLGKKSYHSLAKAIELDPNNTDAIKGQAVALNMILNKGWFVRRSTAVALGINLRDAQKDLIDDLRRFPDRLDFDRLANQLEDKL